MNGIGALPVWLRWTHCSRHMYDGRVVRVCASERELPNLLFFRFCLFFFAGSSAYTKDTSWKNCCWSNSCAEDDVQRESKRCMTSPCATPLQAECSTEVCLCDAFNGLLLLLLLLLCNCRHWRWQWTGGIFIISLLCPLRDVLSHIEDAICVPTDIRI